jgi:energy-coupling factor transporter ATP-binding protein EcfA2
VAGQDRATQAKPLVEPLALDEGSNEGANAAQITDTTVVLPLESNLQWIIVGMDRAYEDALGLSPQERGGDASNFAVSIKSIEIGDSGSVQLPSGGVSLVVGGNNAGKSTLLRQIHQILVMQFGNAVLTPTVLRGLTLEKHGSVADLLSWLGARVPPVTTPGSVPGFSRFGASVSKDMASQLWSGSPFGGPGQLGDLGRIVALLATARERFGQTNPLARRADFTLPPSGPLHRLEDDPELFAELSRYSKEVFGVGLTLDPLSGNVMLRFGDTEVPAPPVDAVTPEYRKAVASLAPIGEQGDGIASTVGLLLPLVGGEYPIALVDEPEAFLHPPQAFKLGHALAKVSKQHGSQLVLATHDRNIVTGVLSEDEVPTTVIRLIRSNDRVVAKQIDPARLRAVWRSPALRHSNIIDGLFHRAVVIAENERDCVFYSAALEAMGSLPSQLSPSDVLFLPSHGLGGVVEIAEVLRAAAVPVVVAADLDATRDRSLLKRVLLALGGQWTDALEQDFTASTAEFRQPKPQPTRAQVLGSISAVLNRDPIGSYTAEDRKQVKVALNQDDQWEPVKRYGLTAFRADRPAADRTLASLDKDGVVLVQVGELEGFAPTLQVAKGINWLPAALEARAEHSQHAQEYAERLVTALLEAERRVSA